MTRLLSTRKDLTQGAYPLRVIGARILEEEIWIATIIFLPPTENGLDSRDFRADQFTVVNQPTKNKYYLKNASSQYASIFRRLPVISKKRQKLFKHFMKYKSQMKPPSGLNCTKFPMAPKCR